MAITITITEISLETKNTGLMSGSDRASIKVNVKWDQSSIPMLFGVTGYENLDDIAEKMRLQILDFATQLQEAARSPLRGSQRSP